MAEEPIKNEDNKSMAIVGWLGLLGAIILIATGKTKEDPQMNKIFYQSLIWGICQFAYVIPVIGWLIGIFAFIMLVIGIIKAFGGKVWESPLVGGFAHKKAYGEQ